jgi:hypothetical protein
MHDGTLSAAQDEAGRLAEALPGWARTRAILHELRDPSRLPALRNNIRFIDRPTIDRIAVPEQLRRELRFGKPA